MEGKQNTIDDGDLTIAKTDGLQTALDNKYDDTGGTIDGDVTISGDLVIGTTNVITEIGTKQDTINDGDLTIAKTDGLQTALNNKYDNTGGTIGGNVTINGDLVVGTTNVITEIGTKQDTINDGDLTIAKTDGLQTALENKYDDTGGTIGGNVSITGDLVVGTTNVITEIGTKQDTINDGDLTIAKTDGLQTALENKYDDTGGTIGGNVSITGDLVVGTTNVITEIGTKQDTINDGDLTIAKTDGLQTALDNKYDDTGGTINGNVDISGDLVTNGQLDCDLDAFHYSAADDVYTRGVGADVSWTETKRGSTIQNGDSFRPKYTGKYSITLCTSFTSGSSGQVRVGLKLNGSEYNLNGGNGTYLVCVSDSANVDINTFMGTMIVDAVAEQDIKAFVIIGTLRYYGSHSYLAGYYIGNT